MFNRILVLVISFLLDFIFGDPQNPIHPIRIIGFFISSGISAYKKLNIRNHIVCFVLGMILSIIVVSSTYIITKIITSFFYNVNNMLGVIFESVLCYFLIAAKALKDESMKVYRSICSKDLDGARKNLSYIVGRDTKDLNFESIIKATVETVAENLSDGVIAPLIFIFIGGAPLGIAYKAINTLDSMIGYKNEQFEFFGKFAARLDDVVNLIPSRVSAIMMIASTFFTGLNTRYAIKIYIRDRYNHKSPNSAQTESVCAGALELCLGGDNYYKGVLVHKQTIGDKINNPSKKHIILVNKLMYATAISTIITMTLIIIVRFFIHV